MIAYEVVNKVNRSAEDTFDVIGTHLYENHPKWEREVIEIRRITQGPVGVGSRAVMVRHEFGRTTESEYVIREFEQGRRLAAYHPDDAMDFDISFEITPIDSESCTVGVKVRAEPKGWTRILEPMMRLFMPRRGQRIANSMVDVVESSPARA
jgi:hypothetical protein